MKNIVFDRSKLRLLIRSGLFVALGTVYVFSTGTVRVSGLDYAVGLLSLLCELQFLLMIISLANRKQYFWAVAVLITSVMAFIWAASIQYFAYFRNLPGKFALDYLNTEFSDAISTSQDGLALWGLATFVIFVSLTWGMRRARSAIKLWWLQTLLFICALFVLRNAYRVRPGTLTPTFDALFSLIAVAGDHPLRMPRLESRAIHWKPSTRLEIPAFNTLLIVNESLRADRVSPLHIESHSTFSFSHAFSNSSYTHQSFPSLLSGVSPLQTQKELLHSQLIFEKLKAQFDIHTSVISSHSYLTGNYISFLQSPALDELRYRESEGWPAYNNVGAHDKHVVDAFAKSLAGHSSKFFTILHFNGTHYPYRSDKGELNYDEAVTDLEKRWQDVFQALGERLDFTVIVIASDHGEALGENHSFGHFTPLQPSTTRVPLMVLIPKTMDVDFGNLDRAVSNLDIVPTLLALYNRPEKSYSGQNLLAIPSEMKTIPISNGFTGQDFVSFAIIENGVFKSYKWERDELQLSSFFLHEPNKPFTWQKADCRTLRAQAIFDKLPCSTN